MKVFIDMLGREVAINFPLRRIISLVPSQTELLYDLGLDEQIIGITKFCVHPGEWFRSKRRVGGTKQLHIDIIRELNPDLVIANKEENDQSQVEEIAKEFPVWVSDIRTVDDALTMITSIGGIVDRKDKADTLAEDIRQSFTALPQSTTSKRVAYFIWYRPWMTAGGDTFISSVIEKLGWRNLFQGQSRYPEVDLSQLAADSPDLVLLSSEPFPFKAKHIAEIKQMLPAADVRLVDGEMFSWYGSRMLKAVPYFRQLLTEE